MVKFTMLVQTGEEILITFPPVYSLYRSSVDELVEQSIGSSLEWLAAKRPNCLD